MNQTALDLEDMFSLLTKGLDGVSHFERGGSRRISEASWKPRNLIFHKVKQFTISGVQSRATLKRSLLARVMRNFVIYV